MGRNPKSTNSGRGRPPKFGPEQREYWDGRQPFYNAVRDDETLDDERNRDTDEVLPIFVVEHAKGRERSHAGLWALACVSEGAQGEV